ncbi:MAG TPA: glycosyltransferase family 4 protein, partial [Candidatus Babeliaceae bacterium]|nr:glycosyltransferase family 4 protein [Candidatus Babeliaceae bacterium]
FFSVHPARDSNRFVTVGRFVEKKAPLLTIQAFSCLLDAGYDGKLSMVGSGPELDKCKQLVWNLGISSIVDFVGIADKAQIAELFSQSLAFIQHSVTARNGDSEGTPVVILEAMAAGLPIISTRHAGIPDVVKHGKTGLLVDEHDVKGMAEAMIQLFQHKDLAMKMGEAGRLLIKNSYTMDRHIDTLYGVLEQAVSFTHE